MKILNIIIHSNAHLQFCIELERCQLHKAAGHPMKCDVSNDIKLFPTVYHRIYFRNFCPYPIRGCVIKASGLEFLLYSSL